MNAKRKTPWGAAGILLLCLLLLLGGCRFSPNASEVKEAFASGSFNLSDISAAVKARDGYIIRAAVLYNKDGGNGSWQRQMDYLEQSLLANLEAEALPASEISRLAEFDVIYLDESLLLSPGWDVCRDAVIEFTAQGGGVLVPNGFCSALPGEYLGISETVRLESLPENLDYPSVPGDLTDLQILISDFHSLYREYADWPVLQDMDYGYGFRTDTAVPLCLSEGTALYAFNEYEDGFVLLCSPLLPNGFVQSAFSMEAEEGQTAFAPSAASCNQLFLNDFAALAAKRQYGMALWRVFGNYGSPSMSWELHYEDITAIEHNSMEDFSRRAEALGQIPSFSLIRNPYFWFAQSETAGYALNASGNGDLDFTTDRYESAYSSGTHIDSSGVWLQGSTYRIAGSYFDDHPEENYRYYPCAADWDGDGTPDLFCGSVDGNVYYYRGVGFTGLDGRLQTGPVQQVDGVSVGRFSSPRLLDVDGDGKDDLIVGSGDGSIQWFRSEGGLSFTPQGELLRPFAGGQCLPAAGDVDGDGIPDLIAGSDQGQLLLYPGQRQDGRLVFPQNTSRSLSFLCKAQDLGSWLSPSLCDFDNDGRQDLVLGTYDGYVALYRGDGTGLFAFQSFITSRDMNYKGNGNLKFGTYCSPLLLDLNGDGSLDLLCGYEEYGLAYPIDSPYFPYRDALQAQIDYMKDHHYFVGVHLLTGPYTSAEREAQELEMHKAAFASYGLSAEGSGANMHTWYVSSFSPVQTLRSMEDAGLLWQSGFSPSRSTQRTPQNCAENAVALPYFLMKGDERGLLVQNVSVLGHGKDEWTSLSARYGMPVCAYFHCDWIYQGGTYLEDALKTMDLLSRFQQENGYNFVREDQMMKASAAAYNLKVDVSGKRDGLVLRPRAISSDGALYDENAQNACGIRLDFASGFAGGAKTDSSVWKTQTGDLIVGLDGKVKVMASPEGSGCHLTQVNLPAEIRADGAGAELEFLDGGMMQVIVSGPASTEDEGWSVTDWGGQTRFTKFGAADSLHIQYQEAN